MAVFDIFGDGSCIALYEFENNLNDTGGSYHLEGSNYSFVDSFNTSAGRALSLQGTPDSYVRRLNINVPNIVTVSFWVKTNNLNKNQSFIGFSKPSNFVDVYYWGADSTKALGINCWNNDCYGIANANTVLSDWTHIVAEFHMGDLFSSKMWINGEPVSLSQVRGTTIASAVATQDLVIGNGFYSDQALEGYIDHVRIFNRALTDDEVKTLYYELLSRILFAKPDGSVWYFDESSSTWQQVTADKSLLTEADFQTYGNSVPLNISKTTLQMLDSNPEVLAWNSSTGVSSAKLVLSVISYDKLVVQNSPILLYDYDSINSIAVNITGTGNIRFLISRDLTNWYKWDGTQWVLVKSGTLDYTNQSDIDLVLNNGMSPSIINSLTWSEIQQLYEGGSPDKIAFAFALQNNTGSDNITLDSIVLNVAPKAFWEDVTDKCTILQGYSQIIVTFTEDGEYKINYQDTEAASSEIDGGHASG